MTSYERGKKAGERTVQFELWDVEHDWKEDRQRLISERNTALQERDDWRERAENLMQKLRDRQEVAA